MTPDLDTRLRHLLEVLRMRGALEVLDERLPEEPAERVAVLECLVALLEAEDIARTERRIERRIRESRLPDYPTLEAFDFDFQPALDRRLVLDLATLAWVDRGENLVIVGQSGVGKSHIGKALCMIACKRNRRVRYTSCADLLTDLHASLADHSLSESLKQYTRPELLMIDDLGYDPIEQERSREAQLLYKVLDARHTRRSTIITSNLPVEDWAAYMKDQYLTVALLDRLLYHATSISIRGPSYRLDHHRKCKNAMERLKREQKPETK